MDSNCIRFSGCRIGLRYLNEIAVGERYTDFISLRKDT